MSIEDIEARANRAQFKHVGVDATVTVPGGLSQDTRILIDRNAAVYDEYGIAIDSRCEISLFVEDTGDGTRGTLADTGKPGDCWRLLEPIGNDGLESRWTAAKA